MKSNNKEKLCLAQEVHVQAYVCVASRWAKKVEKYTIARRFHARRLHARIRLYTITARRFHAFCSSTAGTSAYSICVVVGILTSGAWRLRGSVVPFLRMHLVECGSRRVHPSRCLLCTWPALSNRLLQMLSCMQRSTATIPSRCCNSIPRVRYLPRCWSSAVSVAVAITCREHDVQRKDGSLVHHQQLQSSLQRRLIYAFPCDDDISQTKCLHRI